MSGYLVVTGTGRTARLIGKGSVETVKEAKARANKFLAKHPNSPCMIMTIKRVKVWNRPKKKKK